jgi:hypothetical protein
MRRFLIAMLVVPVGYLVFAFAGYWAIELFSDNGFDRSLEASMTAVFVIGPGGAIIGFISGLILGGTKRVTRI